MVPQLVSGPYTDSPEVPLMFNTELLATVTEPPVPMVPPFHSACPVKVAVPWIVPPFHTRLLMIAFWPTTVAPERSKLGTTVLIPKVPLAAFKVPCPEMLPPSEPPPLSTTTPVETFRTPALVNATLITELLPADFWNVPALMMYGLPWLEMVRSFCTLNVAPAWLTNEPVLPPDALLYR